MTTAVKISNTTSHEPTEDKNVIVVKDNGVETHRLKPGDSWSGHLFAGRTIEIIEADVPVPQPEPQAE